MDPSPQLSPDRHARESLEPYENSPSSERPATLLSVITLLFVTARSPRRVVRYAGHS